MEPVSEVLLVSNEAPQLHVTLVAEYLGWISDFMILLEVVCRRVVYVADVNRDRPSMVPYF